MIFIYTLQRDLFSGNCTSYIQGHFSSSKIYRKGVFIMMDINSSLFRLINDLGFQIPALNPIFIFIAEYFLYVLIIVLIYYLFKDNGKHRMMVFAAVVSCLLAVILGKIAGQFHYNVQPFVTLDNVNQLIDKEVNNSFPSDHTILSFTICMTLFLFDKRRWYFLLIGLLVGVSRVWVGVHYPFDVLTSIVLSIVAALIVSKVFKKFTAKQP